MPSLCAAAAALSAGAGAPLRGLRPPPVTLPARRPAASDALPLDHPRLRARGPVEQVHVDGGHPDEAWVVWVTQKAANSTVSYAPVADPTNTMQATGFPQTYSSAINPSLYYPVPTTCKGPKNYTVPECYYTSGVIHTVHLEGLTPGTQYQYIVEGDSHMFNFTTPPAVGPDVPISFGVVGDLGQSSNASNTLKGLENLLRQGASDVVLHAGDLSYADGYGPRWDSYANMGESLWASVPAAYTGGNHEFTGGAGSGIENWEGYRFRYPNSHLRAQSTSFLWHSFEAGPAHAVLLCSYAAYGAGSLQRAWLADDLRRVDRSRTPWVVAMWHTPWYTSNHHHPMSEGAEMRASMEQLIVDAGVDVVIGGHVHAYERSLPVRGGALDCDAGVPHVTIGDGGNREGFATPWEDPQPDWSAVREYAYGFGQLDIRNATHAHWMWLRNDDPWNPNPGHEVGDEFWMVRGEHPDRGCGHH